MCLLCEKIKVTVRAIISVLLEIVTLMLFMMEQTCLHLLFAVEFVTVYPSEKSAPGGVSRREYSGTVQNN
jgi:hypothetical protein